MMKKYSVRNILNFVLLFDLIFGGSGRLIMLGPLSFRTILFAAAMVYTFVLAVTGKTTFEGRLYLLIALFVVYLFFNVTVIGEKSLSEQFDFLSRYLYIILVFFYETYFSGGPGGSNEKIRKMFCHMVVLFALFSLLLWAAGFMLGKSRGYDLIEMRFFRPYVYGNMDYIGSRIPRIFMKSSIFVPVGLMFFLDDYLSDHSPRSVLKIIICGLALVTTFTTGLYFSTAICLLLLLHHRKVLTGKMSILIVFGLVAVMVAAWRFGLVDLMLSRYSGNYSTSYRTIQMESILKEFSKKPIFGFGFGHEFTTYYGTEVRTTPNFEISWGELLVDTGMTGFVLFTAGILTIMRRLRLLSHKDDIYYVFRLGLIVICLESFTNPFINNSIGLTYYALCAGMANAALKQKKG